MAQYGLLPPSSVPAGLLGYDEKQARLDAFLTGLGNTSAALLAAGAPSTDPGNFGRNMAKVAPGFAQGFQGSMQNARNMAFQDMQAQQQQQQMLAQKQKMEQEQQAALAKARAVNAAFAPAGPTAGAAQNLQGQNGLLYAAAQADPDAFLGMTMKNAMTPPKPMSASELLAVDTPQGPRYMPASQAVGKQPYQKPEAAPKVTPYTEMAKLELDFKNGLISQPTYEAKKASLNAPGALDSNQAFNAEQKLYSQFQDAISTEADQVGAYRRIEAIYQDPTASNAKVLRVGDKVFEAEGQGAADLALIFNYMKMLDPRSVVRESEFELAAKTGGAAQRADAYIQEVMSGGKLSSGMRKKLVAQARNQFDSANRSIGGKQKSFLERAGRYKSFGVDPERAIYYENYSPLLDASMFMENAGANSMANPPEGGTVGAGGYSGVSNEDFMSPKYNPFARLGGPGE